MENNKAPETMEHIKTRPSEAEAFYCRAGGGDSKQVGDKKCFGPLWQGGFLGV